jgi:hypothetical protein
MYKFYPALTLALILFAHLSGAYAQESNNAESTSDTYQPVLPAPGAAITFASFSTINTEKKLAVNPFISGTIGGYYFENRYNYEAANSASVNVGKTLKKKLAGFEITPLIGVVVGGFNGLTSEIQAFHEDDKWYLSADNQYVFEYVDTKRSFYYNWLVGRFKLTRFLRIGVSTQFTKANNQKGVFDRGLTTSILYDNITFNVYAFNYETQRRNYMISLRYYLKLN